MRGGRAGRDALYDALTGCGGICGAISVERREGNEIDTQLGFPLQGVGGIPHTQFWSVEVV